MPTTDSYTCSHADGSCPAADPIDALRARADRATRLLQHEDAAALRQRILQATGERGASAYSLLRSFTELVESLRLSGKYSTALTWLNEANATLHAAVDDEARALMSRHRSLLHECSGAFAEAHAHLQWGAATWPQAASQPDELVRQRLLLRRWLAALGAAPPASSDKRLRAQLKRLETRVTAAIVSVGKWPHAPAQTPHEYDARLSHVATAWPALDTWPSIGHLASLLTPRVHALRAEAEALLHAGRFASDADCILHVPGARAPWSRFEVSGEWHSDLGDDGCSAGAPVACAVLREARGRHEAARVVRAGYSVVPPSGWLRPHFGRSNRVLKLHIGLAVPAGACAWMAVGGEARAWSAGEVLLFDDSFEHEVRNECDAQRIVFQVVVRHPAVAHESSVEQTRMVPVGNDF